MNRVSQKAIAEDAEVRLLWLVDLLRGFLVLPPPLRVKEVFLSDEQHDHRLQFKLQGLASESWKARFRCLFRLLLVLFPSFCSPFGGSFLEVKLLALSNAMHLTPTWPIPGTPQVTSGSQVRLIPFVKGPSGPQDSS